jgi:molecular chaperone GrpE
MEEKQKKHENKDELKALQLKCEEYLNGWKRERADFLNYKKDEMERIGQLIKYANEELVLKLLPILDNFCLAEQHVKDPGVTQIKKQLEDLLKKEGIDPLKTLYEKFDPNYMEVVEEVSAREASHNEEGWDSEESGIVVEEVQRGYKFHDKLLRPAKVKVTK